MSSAPLGQRGILGRLAGRWWGCRRRRNVGTGTTTPRSTWFAIMRPTVASETLNALCPQQRSQIRLIPDMARRPLAAGVPIRRLGATGGGVIVVVDERPLRIEDVASVSRAGCPTTWPVRAEAIAD